MVGVLTGPEIKARLDQGEIFERDTWTPENLRAARYDIRIADDFMIIPVGESRTIQKYPAGKKHSGPILLYAGEVGFFSSLERFVMPDDLAGNIGAKTKFARQGVLVVTGMFIDPGFGKASKNERASFVLFNLGTEPMPVVPGQSIASVQFFSIAASGHAASVTSRADAEHELFDENALVPRFGLLQDLATLRTQVSQFERSVRDDMREMERELARVGEGANQIVLFGVFVLSATILGGMFSYFLSVMSNEQLVERLRTVSGALPAEWPQAFALIAIIVILAVLLTRIVAATGEVLLGFGVRARGRAEHSWQERREPRA